MAKRPTRYYRRMSDEMRMQLGVPEGEEAFFSLDVRWKDKPRPRRDLREALRDSARRVLSEGYRTDAGVDGDVGSGVDYRNDAVDPDAPTQFRFG